MHYWTTPPIHADMPCFTISIILWCSCFLLTVTVVVGQFVKANETIPQGIDGANPLIAAIAGSSNVSMFCEVVLISSETLVRTLWELRIDGQAPEELLFSDGVGQPGFENYMTTPNADFRRALTILTFDSSFDNTRIGCGAGDDIVTLFDLRIISKNC